MTTIYQIGPEKSGGGIRELQTSDSESQQSLLEILSEIKQLNLQAAIITDNFLDDSDVEVD